MGFAVVAQRSRYAAAAFLLLAAVTLLSCGRVKRPRTQPHPTPAVRKPLSSSEIAARALPAVVTIEVAHTGLGSGVLISDYGTVLTCYHVVGSRQHAVVKLRNGSYLTVSSLRGLSKRLDLAVVEAAGRELPHLPIGDSSRLKPGDRVLTVGSPQGLESTVSDGIVSAIRLVRDFPDAMRSQLLAGGRREDDELIQFTAPISPGNSGGPLINSYGEAVGIVAMSLPSADNIYFAIPINQAKKSLASHEVLLPKMASDGLSHPAPRWPTRPPADTALVETPRGNGLNMRTSASQYAPCVPGKGLVPDGAQLQVMARKGDWLYVRTEDGISGWVRWRYKGLSYVTR